MATYNGEKFLEDQLSSILVQLEPEDELIISDDSSSDRTVEIIQRFSDDRIRFLGSFNFRNPIKNFENALKSAKGNCVFLADQDDIWLNEKYPQMVELLKQYDLVISDSMIVDEDLALLNPSFFKYFGSGKGIIKNIVRSSYYGNCMAFRKKVLDAALPFPDTKEIGHDLWIGLVAEITGSVYFYEKPLVLYRRHKNTFTTSSTTQKRSRTFSKMLIGRLIMLKEITKFYTNSLLWKPGSYQ